MFGALWFIFGGGAPTGRSAAVTGHVTIKADTKLYLAYASTQSIAMVSQSALNVETLSMSSETKTQSSTLQHTTRSGSPKITSVSMTPEKGV